MQCTDVWTSTWHSIVQLSRAVRMASTQRQEQSTATKTHILKEATAALPQKVMTIRGWRWISVQLCRLSASSSPTEETVVVTFICVYKILHWAVSAPKFPFVSCLWSDQLTAFNAHDRWKNTEKSHAACYFRAWLRFSTFLTVITSDRMHIFYFRSTLKQLHHWTDGRVTCNYGAHLVELRRVCSVSRCCGCWSNCVPAVHILHAASQISHRASWTR